MIEDLTWVMRNDPSELIRAAAMNIRSRLSRAFYKNTYKEVLSQVSHRTEEIFWDNFSELSAVPLKKLKVLDPHYNLLRETMGFDPHSTTHISGRYSHDELHNLSDLLNKISQQRTYLRAPGIPQSGEAIARRPCRQGHGQLNQVNDRPSSGRCGWY